MRLTDLFEFAPSGGNGDDKYKKIRDIFIAQILKTVELDKKQMMELRESLEHVDCEEIAEIVEAIEAIVEWHDEDPNGIKIRHDWFELGQYKIDEVYYLGVFTMYDDAWSRVYDKKLATLRANGEPMHGDVNKVFPYMRQIDHHIDDVRAFVKELYKTFPTFAVAAEKGIENMKRGRK